MQDPRFGLGFRSPYFAQLCEPRSGIDWLEIVADDYVGVGGPRRAMLARLRADRPLALHGVSLSIAGSAPLSEAYLQGLRALADEMQPAWISDHLCWTALGAHASHDLLPVAYTREVLAHVAARVAHVQERLGRRLLLENASAYVAFRHVDMDEAAFLAELARRTGCGILLDVNNLQVNATNLGLDPYAYLAAVPADAVGYMHLAGHAVLPDVAIDTHDAAVPPPVWALFDAAVRRFPGADVVIERDDALPPLAELVAEVAYARARHRAALGAAAAASTPPAVATSRVSAVAPREAPAWRATQDDFWARLVDKPLGFDHGRGAGLTTLLDGVRPVTAARGMRVYSDAYTATMRRALATNFPALAHVLRADDFAALTVAYLRAHPPAGHAFRSLGRALPAFVARFGFAVDYGVPAAVLAEMTALEQAQLDVQDAGDADVVVSPAALAAIGPEAWPEARVAFVPALRLLRGTHDVLPVLEAVARGETAGRPEPGHVAYLVSRSGDGVCTERLSAPDALALERLQAGDTVARACEAAASPAPVDAAAVERTMRLLVSACARGFVAALHADTSPA